MTGQGRQYRIVLLSGLGDVVHGLPVVNAIRDAEPHARITWVVEPMPAVLLAGHPSIDHIVHFQRREGMAALKKLRKDLEAAPPADVTLNMNVYLKSIWPTMIARSPRRIGFGRDRSYEGVWLVSNEHLPRGPIGHTADMFLEFLDQLGVPRRTPEWRIHFSPEELESQSALRERMDAQPIATIIPASSTPKKDWIPARWAQVADALAKDFGFRVMIAGGPSEREAEIAAEIKRSASIPIETAMAGSVRGTAGTIAASNLVLAPDTGPLHIARALGVPVIGLFGHTNPWRVGPWRAYQDLWVDQYTEPGKQPDASDRTPKWDRMATIEVREVVERIAVACERYMQPAKREVPDA